VLHPVKSKDLKDSRSIELYPAKFFTPCSRNLISQSKSATSRLKSKIVCRIIEIKRGSLLQWNMPESTALFKRFHGWMRRY